MNIEMTMGYLIDHTLIEALFDQTHENHEQALSLIYFLDQKQLYITFSELIKVMNFCKEYDDETKKEMFRLITEITKVLNIYENEIFKKILGIYVRFNGEFDFSDCINIYYMNYRKFWNFVSFDDRYDKVDKVKRVYNVKNGEIIKKQ